MTHHILLVEDEDTLRENYQTVLQAQNYTVSSCANVPDALAILDKVTPDLAILDIMLGIENDGGFQVFKAIRERFPATPIVFLTALDGEYDKISAFKLGAWDYLTKDISLELFVAKIQALFQIAAHITTSDKSNQADSNIKLDTKNWQVIYRDVEIAFTLTEFAIIQALLSEADSVLTHEQLGLKTQQKVVTINTIAAHIRHIRAKFKKVNKDFNHIETVHSRGYIWKT